MEDILTGSPRKSPVTASRPPRTWLWVLRPQHAGCRAAFEARSQLGADSGTRVDHRTETRLCGLTVGPQKAGEGVSVHFPFHNLGPCSRSRQGRIGAGRRWPWSCYTCSSLGQPHLYVGLSLHFKLQYFPAKWTRNVQGLKVQVWKRKCETKTTPGE
jgi:hypothetical protein